MSLISTLIVVPLVVSQDDPDEYIGAAKLAVLCLKTLGAALKEGTYMLWPFTLSAGCCLLLTIREELCAL